MKITIKSSKYLAGDIQDGLNTKWDKAWFSGWYVRIANNMQFYESK